jgi:hypothetical protein
VAIYQDMGNVWSSSKWIMYSNPCSVPESREFHGLSYIAVFRKHSYDFRAAISYVLHVDTQKLEVNCTAMRVQFYQRQSHQYFYNVTYSSVSIVTTLWARRDDRGIGSSPCRERGCSTLPKHSDRIRGKRCIFTPKCPHWLWSQPRDSSPGVNRPAREAHHWPPTSAEINEE